MSSPTNRLGWVGGRVAFVVLLAIPVVAADAPLFPVPLHLVRRVEDPISNTSTDVDEYCSGNTIVTVRGAKTAIVDYAKRELLEIDRAASTYSVASFDEIARAKSIVDTSVGPPSRQRQSAAATRDQWKVTPLGMRPNKAARSADSFELVAADRTIEVSVDRQITLSRSALDAITGNSFPNKPNDQQEAVARACARQDVPVAQSAAGAYGLPLDQSITIDVDSKTRLTIHNSIVSLTNDLPSPDLLAIPAGAALVESQPARMMKQLKELEQKTQRP